MPLDRKRIIPCGAMTTDHNRVVAVPLAFVVVVQSYDCGSDPLANCPQAGANISSNFK